VLLILAAQVGILGERGVPAAVMVRANLERVLATARSAVHPPLIVHVRHCGGTGDVDEPGAPGHALALEPAPGEPVLDKRKNNAFAGTPLGTLVARDAELVVVGLQSDFCVRATCSAALGRGNSVLLIRGAHATYDREEIWAGGTVTPAQEVEAEIEAELEEAGVVLLEMSDLPALFAE
ncbi:Isochorismatase-like protein, partial [Gloeopeniophorella convolvens]